MSDRETRKKIFGKLARAARERAGYAKRPAFARATGLSIRTIAAVELGEEGAGGRESRSVVAEALGFDTGEVEDYINGKTDDVPKVEPRSTVELDLEEILTAPRETVIKISRLVEQVSGPAAAESFLLNALELRRKHADQGRDIKPPGSGDRDVS